MNGTVLHPTVLRLLLVLAVLVAAAGVWTSQSYGCAEQATQAADSVASCGASDR